METKENVELQESAEFGSSIVMWESVIGDSVKATMDNINWFNGVYVNISDVMAQYGILRDDIGEVRYFVHAEPTA